MSDPIPEDPVPEEVGEIPEEPVDAVAASQAAALQLATETLADFAAAQAVELPKFRESTLHRGLWAPRNRAGALALDAFATANPAAKLADFQDEIQRLRGIHGD